MNYRAENRQRKARDAFTLIEFLVVIAIVAILAALLIPVFSDFVARAKGVTCANNMRQVGAALMLYRGENNGYFPPGHPVPHGDLKETSAPIKTQGVDWHTLLVPAYLDEIPICPSLRVESAKLAQQKVGSPKEYFKKAKLGTYGINTLLIQMKLEAMPWPPIVGYGIYPYSQSRIPFVMETGGGNTTWSLTHQDQVLRGIPAYGTLGRHHGSGDTVNVLFLDGHMDKIRRNDPARPITAVADGKGWIYPDNPNAKFASGGINDLYFPPNRIDDARFYEMYGRPEADTNH